MYKLKKSIGIHLPRHEFTKTEGGRYRYDSTYSKPWSEIEVNAQLHVLAALSPVTISGTRQKECRLDPEEGLEFLEERIYCPDRCRTLGSSVHSLATAHAT